MEPDQGQQTGTIGELNNLGNSGEIRKVGNARQLLLLRKVYDNAFCIAFEEISRTLPRAVDENWREANDHEQVIISECRGLVKPGGLSHGLGWGTGWGLP